MIDSEIEAKITIIIEAGDRTQTITIPKATHIRFTPKVKPELFSFPMNESFFTESIDLDMSLVALFDNTKGHIYLVENSTVAKEVPKSDAELHATCSHPDYEYEVTEGQRKSWADADTPPEGEGWTRNIHVGRDGWDRFDYTEESYWKRKKYSNG